jgi:dTDP-4-dehydrorhamnose reductase
MRVLVFGSEGMLGKDVVEEFSHAFHDVVPVNRTKADITQPSQVKSIVNTTLPDLVINCAAFTDVNLAETEQRQAILANGFGPPSISRAAANIGVPIIHISTDYVFNGDKVAPYVESDKTDPINYYGFSKMVGEMLVKASNSKHFVVRTAGLYGANGTTFIDKVLSAYERGEALKVVNDQFTNPTSTRELARAILALSETQDYGIHHLASTGACSWYEFAQVAMSLKEIKADIEPISYKDLEGGAKRPEYSVLWTEKPKEHKMKYWRDALRDFILQK